MKFVLKADSRYVFICLTTNPTALAFRNRIYVNETDNDYMIFEECNYIGVNTRGLIDFKRVRPKLLKYMHTYGMANKQVYMPEIYPVLIDDNVTTFKSIFNDSVKYVMLNYTKENIKL